MSRVDFISLNEMHHITTEIFRIWVTWYLNIIFQFSGDISDLMRWSSPSKLWTNGLQIKILISSNV